MPRFVSGILRQANAGEPYKDTAVGLVLSLAVPTAACSPVVVQAQWSAYGRSAREAVCIRSLDTAKASMPSPSAPAVACLLVAVMTTPCASGRSARNVASTHYAATPKKLPRQFSA